MKTRNFLLSSIAFLGLVIFISSCSKDEDNSTNGNDPFVSSVVDPDALKITDDLPNNPDNNALETYSYAIQPKSFLSAYSGFFLVSADAIYTPGKRVGSWSYSFGNYSALYTLDEVSTRYEFQYIYSENGIPFVDVNGWEESDGSEGYLALVEGNSTLFTIDWSRDNSDNYTVELNFNDNGDTVRILATYNNDESGNVTAYENGTLLVEANWDSNGHGSITYYDNGMTETFNF